MSKAEHFKEFIFLHSKTLSSSTRAYPLHGIVSQRNNRNVPVEIVFTDEFETWWDDLTVFPEGTIRIDLLQEK